jgi:Fe-S cluster assembly protein SufD
MVGGKQVADTHSAVFLRQPHGTVNQLHKCIIDDSAHAIFSGKICLPKTAQLTNAAQLNRNLLLSPKARINTKPELQITADNVKCSHGATVSQLSADELFYLRSRGLTEVAARHLLIDAFAAEILERLPFNSLHQQLAQCAACRTVDR